MLTKDIFCLTYNPNYKALFIYIIRVASLN
jgi:hypothetical protein